MVGVSSLFSIVMRVVWRFLMLGFGVVIVVFVSRYVVLLSVMLKCIFFFRDLVVFLRYLEMSWILVFVCWMIGILLSDVVWLMNMYVVVWWVSRKLMNCLRKVVCFVLLFCKLVR